VYNVTHKVAYNTFTYEYTYMNRQHFYNAYEYTYEHATRLHMHINTHT
jgi:hypothetical protein